MKASFLEKNPPGSGQNEHVDSFRCGRCGGLMKAERVIDLFETEIEFMAARCIQCGDIVDPVILMHRSGKGVLRNSTGKARH